MKLIFYIFWTFFKISLFSIGGGYAIIPLIQDEVVNANNWLSIQEFTDIITISQMTLGPLAVNKTSFVGLRIFGVLGAVLATVGVTIAGVTIAINLYCFFNKYKNIGPVANILSGLRDSSVGLIAASSITILLLAIFNSQKIILAKMEFNPIASIVFMISLYILRKYKVSPILVILVSGLSGLLIYI